MGGDREIENRVSVNRLSQALSSYADHRCNAVSKVYTSTTVTLSPVTRHNRTVSRRARAGGAGVGRASDVHGPAENHRGPVQAVLFMSVALSLPPVLRPRSRSGSPPVSRYPLALRPMLPPCLDHAPSTSAHGLHSPMAWKTQHTALRPLRVTTEHMPSPGPSSPITTRIILSPLPSIIHLARFLHSRCHHLYLIFHRPFP